MGGRQLSPLPVLRTERITLEPVGGEHLDLMVALNADPAVMRHLLGRPATPEETHVEWVRRLVDRSDADRGLGYWAGYVADASHEREFVGWWSASSFAKDPTVAGLGYRLRREAWGRGLATEGAREMVAQAFRCPQVTRIVASTMAVNTGSRRVLAKVGLVCVDTSYREWEDPLDGWEQGEVVYALQRSA